jgi:hypothetical protein
MKFMLNVLGDNYFVDFDEIEKYIDMSGVDTGTEPENNEMKVNIIKFELIKMMLEVVLSEETDVDEKLGMKNSNNISVPFKIAFNSLLNKNLINHY